MYFNLKKRIDNYGVCYILFMILCKIIDERSLLTKLRFAKLVFNHFWLFSVLWMPILKEKACVLEAAGATKSPLSWPGMTMLYTDVHKRKTFSGRQRDILLISVKLIIEFISPCPLVLGCLPLSHVVYLKLRNK